jgi:nucleoside triphosphate diphosphatase
MPSSGSKGKKHTQSRLPRKRKSPKSARRPPKTSGGSENFSIRHLGKLFEDLVAIQARLRAPGGCPWDREQTHQTLRTYLIEEAYEVLDAIEKGSRPELAEELGDLLLQVLFHADLAREAGSFDIAEVITGIRDKMIRRHPHVFGNVKAETSGEVLKNWAQLKAKEKASASDGKEKPERSSVLAEVPRSLPALLEAYQLSRRAAQVGFDWENVQGVLDKLNEEAAEIRESLEASSRTSAEEEVGDLLFTIVNLARFLKLDPEVTLKKANFKFKARFQDMESSALRVGASLAQLSKEELEALWESAKAKPLLKHSHYPVQEVNE